MPTLHHRKTRARKRYRCDSDRCAKGYRIEPGQVYLSLWGMAEHGDPPYTVRVHEEDPEAPQWLKMLAKEEQRKAARMAARLAPSPQTPKPAGRVNP
jgi:hypothetical protein